MKITRHAKKQRSNSHDEGKSQSVFTDPELTWILDLSNENTKTILNLFHVFEK